MSWDLLFDQWGWVLIMTSQALNIQISLAHLFGAFVSLKVDHQFSLLWCLRNACNSLASVHFMSSSYNFLLLVFPPCLIFFCDSDLSNVLSLLTLSLSHASLPHPLAQPLPSSSPLSHSAIASPFLSYHSAIASLSLSHSVITFPYPLSLTQPLPLLLPSISLSHCLSSSTLSHSAIASPRPLYLTQPLPLLLPIASPPPLSLTQLPLPLILLLFYHYLFSHLSLSQCLFPCLSHSLTCSLFLFPAHSTCQM